MEVVTAEIKENSARIKRHAPDEVGPRLTLHDWLSVKPALTDLARRNERLWDQVVDAYSKIHDAREGSGPPPEAEDLNELTRQLAEEQEVIRREG